MVKFSDFGLDLRILKAIDELGWSEPTPIQAKLLSYSSERRDIIAQACTGSGKTGAFLLPIIQSVLDESKKCKGTLSEIIAIILSPTKEITHQTHKFLKELTKYTEEVKSVNLSDDSPALLGSYKPTVVIATPSQILHHLEKRQVDITDSFHVLAVDEADLSLGRSDRRSQLIKLTSLLPHSRQTILISATLGLEPGSSHLLGMKNTVTLNLNQTFLPPSSQLSQHVVCCAYKEKYQVMAALLKMNIINQRLLIFVNSVNKCYRLKLFLEQFAIRSCVLNAEMPLACRIHAVEQFNRRVYDIVIASAECRQTSKGKDAEYSTARGVDFHNVAFVINFDFPNSYVSYVHRVGRTARMKNKGVALSFVCPGEEKLMQVVVDSLREGDSLVPYPFDMRDIRGFEYRVQGALSAVTTLAIKEARLREIRAEILNCDKITSCLEPKSRVIDELRHDKVSKCANMALNVKHLPDYILPNEYKDAAFKTPMFSKKRRRRKNGAVNYRSNKTNVLKSLKISK